MSRLEDLDNLDVSKIPLDTLLDGSKEGVDLGAGEWICFYDVPSGVNIHTSLNGNANGARVPVKQGLIISALHGRVYLWSDTILEDETLLIIHGSGEVKITPPPLSDFESLNGYGAGAIAQLDKLLNPHSLINTTIDDFNASSSVDILNKVLTCDKIKISLSIGNGSFSSLWIIAKLDNKIIASARQRIDNVNGNAYSVDAYISVDDVLGKTLTIRAYSGTIDSGIGFVLKEYSLKQ